MSNMRGWYCKLNIFIKSLTIGSDEMPQPYRAVSNRYGPNPPGADRWTLRRIWIDASDSLPTFQAKVTGRLDSLALLDSGWGLRARRALNRLDR